MSKFYELCAGAKRDINKARHFLRNHRKMERLNEGECWNDQALASYQGYEPHLQQSAAPERLFQRQLWEIFFAHPDLVKDVLPCQLIWNRLSGEPIDSEYNWLIDQIPLLTLCKIKYDYYPNDKTPTVKSRFALDTVVSYLTGRDALSVEQFETLLTDYKNMRAEEEHSSVLRFFRRLSFWKPSADEKLQAAENVRDNKLCKAATEGLLGRIMALKPRVFGDVNLPQSCLKQTVSRSSQSGCDPQTNTAFANV